MKHINKKALIHTTAQLTLMAAPLLIYAQSPKGGGGGSFLCSAGSSIKTIADIFSLFTCLLNNSIIPLLFSLAFVMFMWGVIQFVINTSDTAKKEDGRKYMIWGIIGIFVMVSVWGIVKLLTGTFGFTNVIPQLQQ